MSCVEKLNQDLIDIPQTKSYYSYELNNYRVYIYKKLKLSLKWYCYMVRIKIVNLFTKDYVWFNSCAGALDDVDKKEYATDKDIVEAKDYADDQITSKIKDFRMV